MTPLTLNLRMAASEGKTRRAVINFNVRPDSVLSRGRIRRHHCQGRRQRPGNDCPDHQQPTSPTGR